MHQIACTPLKIFPGMTPLDTLLVLGPDSPPPLKNPGCAPGVCVFIQFTFQRINNCTDKEYTDNSVPAGSVRACRKKNTFTAAQISKLLSDTGFVYQ